MISDPLIFAIDHEAVVFLGFKQTLEPVRYNNTAGIPTLSFLLRASLKNVERLSLDFKSGSSLAAGVTNRCFYTVHCLDPLHCIALFTVIEEVSSKMVLKSRTQFICQVVHHLIQLLLITILKLLVFNAQHIVICALVICNSR